MRNLKIYLLAIFLIAAGSPKAQTAADNQPLLSLEAFAAKLNHAKNAQIIDARSAEEFAQNHIKGAVNVDAKAAGYQQRLDALQKDSPTFVCTPLPMAVARLYHANCARMVLKMLRSSPAVWPTG